MIPYLICNYSGGVEQFFSFPKEDPERHGNPTRGRFESGDFVFFIHDFQASQMRV
jgi:hypothetical protein